MTSPKLLTAALLLFQDILIISILNDYLLYVFENTLYHQIWYYIYQMRVISAAVFYLFPTTGYKKMK